jgi:hypothetical protein
MYQIFQFVGTLIVRSGRGIFSLNIHSPTLKIPKKNSVELLQINPIFNIQYSSSPPINSTMQLAMHGNWSCYANNIPVSTVNRLKTIHF